MSPGDDFKITDNWLVQLNGSDSHNGPDSDKSFAENLRHSVLGQHREAENEIDEVRLKRLRNRVLDSLPGATQPRLTAKPWHRNLTLISMAATLAIVAIIPTLFFTVYQPDHVRTSDPVLVRQYGALEIPRGAQNTVEIVTPSPKTAAMEVSIVLERNQTPFELYMVSDLIWILSLNLEKGAIATESMAALEKYLETPIPDGYTSIRFTNKAR